MKTTLLLLLLFPSILFADFPTAKEAKEATEKARLENINRDESELLDGLKNRVRNAIKEGKSNIGDVPIIGHLPIVIDKVSKFLTDHGYKVEVLSGEPKDQTKIIRVSWE